MLEIRKSSDRGYAHHGWLESHFSFSFAEYYDPQHMDFHSLRVINEDIIQPGMGFGTHPHQNMEIISYVISGALEHKDSMGGGSIIRSGDVQFMRAGTGIQHSEFNPSQTEPVHLLQIWVEPDTKDLKPVYDQKHFTKEQRTNTLCPIVSVNGKAVALSIHQDIDIYASLLEKQHIVSYAIAEGRHVWLQLLSGSLLVNDVRLDAGDALAISEELSVSVKAIEQAEFLLFDCV